MATKAKRRIRTASRRALSRLALVAAVLVAGLATGCNVLQGSKDKKHDPLFGEYGPKKDSGSGPTKTSANVPPIPSASSNSNAALAMATLPGSKQLSIGEPERPPSKTPTAGTLTSAVPPPAVVPPGGVAANAVLAGGAPPGSATLSRPQPVVVSVPRDSAVQTAGANQEQTSEFFLSPLRARGVSWHRADSVAGGIRFACIVPNRQNPSVTRIFEATAADFPSAVNAVLQQIDNQK
ncbi:MAG: hypothetical protein FJ271_28095 [Planctomycetes bacterium]|nr:hypothetical protein [Planctomycetota bacterium]